MNGKMTRLAAACVIAGLALPTAAMAGTRASTTTVVSKGNATPGPKNGFPSSPGLEIAKIKANDNAAFKRNKSNGC